MLPDVNATSPSDRRTYLYVGESVWHHRDEHIQQHDHHDHVIRAVQEVADALRHSVLVAIVTSGRVVRRCTPIIDDDVRPWYLAVAENVPK